LINHLIEITKYDSKITANWIDEEMIADLYVKIANEYIDSPDLRLTWLENLSVIHVQNGNIEEAAQCKIHMAYLVLQYIQSSNQKLLPVELRELRCPYFQNISPNIFNEKLLLGSSSDRNSFFESR